MKNCTNQLRHGQNNDYWRTRFEDVMKMDMLEKYLDGLRRTGYVPNSRTKKRQQQRVNELYRKLLLFKTQQLLSGEISAA